MTAHRREFDASVPEACRGGAVSVGNFDGVHRGHQALIEEVRRRAREVGGPAVAVTFDPHPLQLLRPDQFQPVLTSIEDRAALLGRAGADQVVILHTAPALLALSAEEFFRRIVRESLDARAVIEGPNFRFGRDRGGDVKLLRKLCRDAQVDLDIVPIRAVDGVPVSSSRVRDALAQGDVRQAANLLQRPYRLRGRVGTGQGRGKALGFPTANLEGLENVVPGDGVYAVRALVRGAGWPGAANLGANPTFGENTRKVEVHLIGFEGDLVGETVALDFLDRLRDTRRFGSAEELARQLRTDVERANQVAAQGKA
jgi:riboflavin kinase/FMN adenylyltransferase